MPEKVENVLPALNLNEAFPGEQARVDVELDEMARKREQAKVRSIARSSGPRLRI